MPPGAAGQWGVAGTDRSLRSGAFLRHEVLLIEPLLVGERHANIVPLILPPLGRLLLHLGRLGCPASHRVHAPPGLSTTYQWRISSPSSSLEQIFQLFQAEALASTLP